MSTATDADVLVAGGGPAGLAAALYAVRCGLRVTVVEPRRGPVDKACGEGLMPGAVRALAELGVRPAGHDITGIRYTDGVRQAESRFRSGPGRGVRRTTLHAELTAAADAAGVHRVEGRVAGLRQGPDWVEAGGLRGRWLLAADGLHSPLRRELGLQRPARGAARFGLRRHYALRPWSELVEVHWAPGAEAYVTPVGDELVGVALLTGVGRSYDEGLSGFPALLERLGGAPTASSVRGAGPLRQDVHRRSAGRVLLIGDAAGYVDALTGEGLSLGVRSGRAAVDCVLAGRPEAYELAWRRLSRSYRLLTTGLLRARATPWLAPAIVPAAARAPRVFDRAVQVLAG